MDIKASNIAQPSESEKNILADVLVRGRMWGELNEVMTKMDSAEAFSFATDLVLIVK